MTNKDRAEKIFNVVKSRILTIHGVDIVDAYDFVKLDLKKHGTKKSLEILAELEKIAEEYADKFGLCPDCLSELTTTHYQSHSYYEPDAYKLECECGWSV